MALAAASVGVDGFFFETHHDPDNALSDGPNMIVPEKLAEIVEKIFAIKRSLGV